jgi:hypothetical protein
MGRSPIIYNGKSIIILNPNIVIPLNRLIIFNKFFAAAFISSRLYLSCVQDIAKSPFSHSKRIISKWDKARILAYLEQSHKSPTCLG